MHGSGRLLLVGLMLALAGCSDSAPLSVPLGASPSAVAPSPEPSPSPSPSPSPTVKPLSPFEGDPAVVALRAYLVAVAKGVNAKNLELPDLLAVSTRRRAVEHKTLYAPGFGSYYPGPNPFAVLGVRVVSVTSRSVLGCSQEGGFALTKPGGKPLGPRRVVGGQIQLVQEGGRWKVDSSRADPKVSCVGVPLQGVDT